MEFDGRKLTNQRDRSMQKWFLGLSVCILVMAQSCKPKNEEYFSSFGSGDTEEQFTLHITTSGDGEGTVTSELPGIECESNSEVVVDCDEEYSQGTNVNLRANSKDNSNFHSWSGDCAHAGDNMLVMLTMDQDKNCDARFDAISPPEDVVPTGSNIPITMTSPERPTILNMPSAQPQSTNFELSKQATDVSFGNLTGNFITVLAGENGFQVLDLANGEVLLDETNLGGSGPFFEITGASQAPPGENSPAMIFAAGGNGYVVYRFDQAGPLEFDGATFDVLPAGGDPISNVVSFVQPTAGIGFFVYDDSQELYVPAEVGFPADMFGGVELVSAYMHDDVLSDDPVPQPRGNFLVLSRETESGVYLAKWDGSDPVRAIDNIGFDARRIRCIEDDSGTGNLVCVASIFGHDRLGLMTWDGENVPVLTDFAEIGDGPVGIDLRLLSNGNIAIVSTGFNDNTVTETIVAPNGIVQSSSTNPVLDGCKSPGHAVYVQDAESWKILGTCYDSDSYFIVESEL